MAFHKWYVSKKENQFYIDNNLPIIINRIFYKENTQWVEYFSYNYDCFNLYLQTTKDFYKFYEEYNGDFLEFGINPIFIKYFESILEKTVQYINFHNKNTDIIQEKNIEIAKLQRENKILKILSNKTRQKEWQEGEIIENRVAECSYCGKMVLSETSLPFFEKRDNLDTDRYYCGCKGFN